MTRSIAALHVWRLRLPRNRFWVCEIHPSPEALTAWVEFWTGGLDRWEERRRAGRCFIGVCMANEARVRRRHMGLVGFSLPDVGSGLVAHEMTHAAFRTHRLGYGKRLGRGEEELVAYTVELLVRQFWRKWYQYVE